MRGMVCRWSMEPKGVGGAEASADLARTLARTLGVEEVVGRVLVARGFADPEEAAAFARPPMRDMHPPDLLPGIDTAARRLRAALRAGETIAIYGDYDVDGVTATAILFHTLRALEPDARVITYVPHRLDEGYGLHTEAIEKLASLDAKVIVSVDCGVTAFEPARAARALGVDLIITDHHNLPSSDDGMPDAVAVVHPRLPGSRYPFGELCGAGVAFKLAWHLCSQEAGGGRVAPEVRELLLDLMALAALGTIADVVPLEDENRIIARYGLARAGSTSLVGLRALLDGADLPPRAVDAQSAAFLLAPRLNASGRMGHAEEAVELFTTATAARAKEIVDGLNAQNRARQATERAIFEQASAMAEAEGMTGVGHRAIVLAHESWHPGVIGIVCSRLVRTFGRPVVLLQRDGATCRGSGRSIDGFDLHAALQACSETLSSFGGHSMAAGLALETGRLADFQDALIARARAGITEEMLAPSLRVDCEVTLDELTPTTVQQLDALGPFGRANPRPRLLLRDVVADRDAQPLGAGGRHLSVQVRGRGQCTRLVGWRWGERSSALRGGMRLDAVIRPKLNEWQGRVRVEPEIEDLRVID